jgi:hypothetical protein
MNLAEPVVVFTDRTVADVIIIATIATAIIEGKACLFLFEVILEIQKEGLDQKTQQM